MSAVVGVIPKHGLFIPSSLHPVFSTTHYCYCSNLDLCVFFLMRPANDSLSFDNDLTLGKKSNVSWVEIAGPTSWEDRVQ